MATITANTGSNNWNTNGAWVGGVQPTAADDVVIPASAVVTIPAATTALGRSCTVAASGELVFAATTSVLTLGDGTAGAGSVAWSSPGTITLTGIGTINFVSTSTSTQTITTYGRTMPNWTINGAGSNYWLGDANTSSGAVTLTSGRLTTNGMACSWTYFVGSGASTRTLTLGASAITCTSRSGTTFLSWDTAGTGITVNAGTSTITLSGAGAGFAGSASASQTYYALSLTGAASVQILPRAGGLTFTNLTRTGTAVKKDSLLVNGGDATVTGTLTINGNSATNRVLVSSETVGTARTVTAAVVSLSNCDFMDITGAGAAAPFTGTSIGDCGGNSGITFTPAATQTHTASAGGSWSDASKWTSRVPLPQDDVIVNANTSGTLTADMPRLGKSLTFTGFAGTLANVNIVSVYGSLTVPAGVTYTGTSDVQLCGRSSSTLSVGVSLSSSIKVKAPGGTYTQAAALTITGTGMFLSNENGTYDSAGYALSVPSILTTGSATKGYTFGASTVTLTETATGSVVGFTATGCTMSAASATFVIGAASSAARTFVGAGFSYGTLRYTVASSPGSLTITGANTFGTLDIGPGRPLILPSSTTTTVTNMNAAGVPNGYTYLPGTTTNYLSAPDSAALRPTADIDIRVRVALDDWTSAGGPYLISKGLVPRNYRWYVDPTGALQWMSSSDGTNFDQNATSSVAPTIADGAPLWLRVTRRASDGRVQFFTASGALVNPTAGDFTQLGTDRSTTAGAMWSSTGTTMYVGSHLDSSWLAGKLYRAQIRNGLDGTLVFDADLTAKTCGARSFVESSASAATVTINGTSAQAGDGCIVLAASTPGTFATLAKAGGGNVYGLDYLSISDIHATP